MSTDIFDTPADSHSDDLTQAARRKKRIVLLISAAVAVVVALAIIFALFLRGGADPRIDDPPSQEEIASMDIEPLDGEFVIESVGLAMPMEEMSVVNNEINPPGFDSAYVVRDYAEPGDDERMSVIALHSLSGGDVPGNRLIDVDEQEAKVAPGEKITVGDHTYTVESAFARDKLSAQADDTLWADEPGKLLIFTCLQRPDGSASVDNIIIRATLDS